MPVSASASDMLMRALEERFAVRRAIPASRAALGLLAVLEHWRGNRQDCRVALPGAICHEVVLAVMAAGCEPIFCDVDVADGLVKAAEWKKARAAGAEVAIVVHLYGNPAPMHAVRALFPRGECLVIDDAAQALGSLSEDGPAGAMGDVGLLSFGLTKQIPLGNAALLFGDSDFAEAITARLDAFLPADETLRADRAAKFRSRLDMARAELHKQGANAALMFQGMLQGLDPVLFTPMAAGGWERVLKVLGEYDGQSQARIAKARLWSQCLSGSGFEPVGMGTGCVPWRYACRLPGIDWATQHRLAEAMRAGGMHVSTWYLPAHWFVGHGAGPCPGVETLAREVFQFWVDEEATPQTIIRNAAMVRELVANRA